MESLPDRVDPRLDDDRVDQELARIDPALWPTVRARVSALRRVLADPGMAAVDRAAAELGIGRRQVYSLLRAWRDLASVEALAPKATFPARLRGRLAVEVEAALAAAARDALARRPDAGPSTLARLVEEGLAASGVRAPARLTVERRIARLLEDGALQDGTGILVDALRLALPPEEGGGPPEDVVVAVAADAGTGAVLARLPVGGDWLKVAAQVLRDGLARHTFSRTVAVARLDADASRLRAAILGAGADAVEILEEGPRLERLRLRAPGRRLGGVPVRRPAPIPDAAAKATPSARAEAVVAAAVSRHNAGRLPAGSGGD